MIEGVHRCCVCGRDIRPGREVFANAYEEIARRHALCNDSCAAAWDADRHWLPSVAPRPCDGDEARRLFDVARGRAWQGDPLEVLVKDLLGSGVAAAAVEAWLDEVRHLDQLHAQREQTLHRSLALGALFTRRLGLLLGSLWRAWRAPAERPTDGARALIAAWRGRFDVPASGPAAGR